jgi:hypothetical protein
LNPEVLAAPVLISEEQMNWHVPDIRSLESVIAFMREKTDWCLTEIRKLIANTGDATTLAVKKAEEMIVVNLKLLSRLLRGAADILEDELDSTEKHSEEDYLIHTGREALVSQLSASSRDYVRTIRYQILTFLIEFNEYLNAPAAAASASADETVTGSGGVLSAISNSSAVRVKWMKLFKTVIVSRMHTNMSYEQALKFLKIAKRMTRPMFVRAVYREMKKSDDIRSQNPIVGSKYWKFHDYSNYTTRCYVFAVQAKRVREYSNATVRRYLHGRNGPVMMTCLQQLSELCGHEYDEIRGKALKSFLEIAGKFGVHRWIHEVVKPKMSALSNPARIGENIDSNKAYSMASGTLVLLAQNKVLDKVVTSWTLTDAYLHAVLSAPAVIASVTEADKREKLMERLTDALVAYVTKFNHTPIILENDETGAAIVGTALNALGIDSESGALSPTPSFVVPATGLRLEAHASWILLHLIGHRDVELSPGVVTWALRTLSLATGQPSQYLALAATIRLADIAVKKRLGEPALTVLKEMLTITGNDVVDSSSSETTSKPLQSRTPPLSSSTPPPANAASLTPTSLWAGILQGISSCHTKTDPEGSGNAQWAKGIGKLIGSTPFLKAICPRTVYSVVSEHGISQFQREHCATFDSIFEVLFGNNKDVDAVGFVNTLLALSLNIPAHNEEDKRANNATRAELVAGLFRALHKLTGALDRSALSAIDEALTAFTVDQIEKVSFDYSKDWAEAILFALLGHVRDVSKERIGGGLVSYALEGLKQVLIPSTGLGIIDITSSSANDGEGFVKNDKKVLMADAVLQASIGTALISRQQGINNVGQAIVHMYQSEDIHPVNAYQSTRLELLAVATGLNSLSVDGHIDFSVLTQHLVNAHQDAASNVNVIKAEENSASPATPVEDGSGDPPVLELPVTSSSNTKADRANSRLKNVLETVCQWLRLQLDVLPQWKYEPDVVAMFAIVVQGSSHPLPEISGKCQSAALAVCQYVRPRTTGNTATTAVSDAACGTFLSKLVDVLVKNVGNSSIQVRKLVLQCAVSLLSACWTHLSNDDKKRLKDIFAELIIDDKPEVSAEACNCMCAYLMRKPVNELQSLAEVYIKNSEALVTRWNVL